MPRIGAALVTGASGLVGSAIVRALRRRGVSVRALARPARPPEIGDEGVERAVGDVLDAVSLAEACAGMDIVFHAAAAFVYGAPADRLETLAVQGVRNVLRAASEAGAARVILTGSSVVFGFGDTPQIRDETWSADPGREGAYVRSKILQDRAAVQLAQALGLDLVRVCPTMTLGPHARSLRPSNGVITSYLSDPLRLTFEGGCNLVSAEDVGEAHVLAAERGAPGAAYIAGGANLTWAEIHLMIAQLAGVATPSVKLGPEGAFAAAVAAELQGRLRRAPPLTTREQAAMVGRYYWYSHARLAGLGYAPAPIRSVMARTLSFLAASPHLSREARAELRLSPEVWAMRAETLEAVP